MQNMSNNSHGSVKIQCKQHKNIIKKEMAQFCILGSLGSPSNWRHTFALNITACVAALRCILVVNEVF